MKHSNSIFVSNQCVSIQCMGIQCVGIPGKLTCQAHMVGQVLLSNNSLCWKVLQLFYVWIDNGAFTCLHWIPMEILQDTLHFSSAFYW